MSQRDGRAMKRSTASNHVEPMRWFSMAADELITRAQSRVTIGGTDGT
jgi:hypothetical protein